VYRSERDLTSGCRNGFRPEGRNARHESGIGRQERRSDTGVGSGRSDEARHLCHKDQEGATPNRRAVDPSC